MRIGIVNHQSVEALRGVIRGVPGYEIAWVAGGGAEAISRCRLDAPDVLLLRLSLPDMAGAEAVRRIVACASCPILLLAEDVKRDAAEVFAALGAGAADVAALPRRQDGLPQPANHAGLLKKIKTLERLLGPRRSAAALALPYLIIIGSSTGGPAALARILRVLPDGLDAAVVIVQHMDEQFSGDLVDWLNPQTPLPVCLAQPGEQPQAGRVDVAGSNDHLVLNAGRRFVYTVEPRAMPYRPSVDAFFHSVAQYWPRRGSAVLLTGMGRDGARGLAELRQAGWHTIAQDEISSVVYGMPKAAKELGAAVEILPLELIGNSLLKRRLRG